MRVRLCGSSLDGGSVPLSHARTPIGYALDSSWTRAREARVRRQARKGSRTRDAASSARRAPAGGGLGEERRDRPVEHPRDVARPRQPQAPPGQLGLLCIPPLAESLQRRPRVRVRLQRAPGPLVPGQQRRHHAEEALPRRSIRGRRGREQSAGVAPHDGRAPLGEREERSRSAGRPGGRQRDEGGDCGGRHRPGRELGAEGLDCVRPGRPGAPESRENVGGRRLGVRGVGGLAAEAPERHEECVVPVLGQALERALRLRPQDLTVGPRPLVSLGSISLRARAVSAQRGLCPPCCVVCVRCSSALALDSPWGGPGASAWPAP